MLRLSSDVEIELCRRRNAQFECERSVTGSSIPGDNEIGAPGSRVQVFYKRAEIPADNVVPAIAFSVSCRKQEKVENTGSIPVGNAVEPTNRAVLGRLRVDQAVQWRTLVPPVDCEAIAPPICPAQLVGVGLSEECRDHGSTLLFRRDGQRDSLPVDRSNIAL